MNRKLIVIGALALLGGFAPPGRSQTSEAPGPLPGQTSPPTAKRVDGRPVGEAKAVQVWAVPATKLYHRCDDADSREGPPAKKPEGKLMTEADAKAQGFQAAAHHVSCAP